MAKALITPIKIRQTLPIPSGPLPCGFYVSLLEWASLRGSYSLLDSPLQSLPCAMRYHVQRGTITGPIAGHYGLLFDLEVLEQIIKAAQASESNCAT